MPRSADERGVGAGADRAWWRWWQSIPVHLESTLTSEQALIRLQADLVPTWRSSGPIRGHVRRGRIYASTLGEYRNSFLPLLAARVRATPSGCVVDGRVGIYRVVQAFCAVWLGLALYFIVFALVRPGDRLFALAGAAMFAAGFGLMAFATRLGRREVPVLLDWLSTTLASGGHLPPADRHPKSGRSTASSTS